MYIRNNATCLIHNRFPFFKENFFRRAEETFCGYPIRLRCNARSGKVSSSQLRQRERYSQRVTAIWINDRYMRQQHSMKLFIIDLQNEFRRLSLNKLRTVTTYILTNFISNRKGKSIYLLICQSLRHMHWTQKTVLCNVQLYYFCQKLG